MGERCTAARSEATIHMGIRAFRSPAPRTMEGLMESFATAGVGLELKGRIGAEYHDGWWHCYPKFPRDWIKGIGRSPHD